MIVREIIISPVIAVRENCPLEDAAKLMLDGDSGCLPVVNENSELTGIVTDSDFVAKEKELPLSISPLVPWFIRFQVDKEAGAALYKA